MSVSLQIIVSILILFFIVLVLLFFYLIWNKVKMNKTESRIAEEKERLREGLFQYLYRGEETANILPKDKISFMALESLLHDFADVSSGEEMKGRIQQFAEEHFTISYKKQLFHSRWAVRMNVLFAIEKFYMANMVESLLYYYEKKNITTSEEIQVLKVLVKLEHPVFIHSLLNTKTELSELMYRSLIGSMSEVRWIELMDRFEELPIKLKWATLDMIGIQSNSSFVPFLVEQLTSPEAEIRIKALKSIAAIGYPLQFEQVEGHANSKIWEERMMATKLLKAIHHPSAVTVLTRLLSDHHFSVRSQAAQSLSQMKNGKAILFSIYQTAKDPYARDMAAEWLEKGES